MAPRRPKQALFHKEGFKTNPSSSHQSLANQTVDFEALLPSQARHSHAETQKPRLL
jgi:hypothetical protein